MISQDAETADAESINPQIASWAEHARTEIMQNSPESLQKSLLSAVENLINSAASEAELELSKQNLETLIKNARKLNEAVTSYADRMKPLMPFTVLKDNLNYFWDNFELEQLESNALEKVLTELIEKAEASEAEAKGKKETSASIENLIEKKKLAPYFTTRERKDIYTQYKQIREAANLTQDQKDAKENDFDLKVANETLKRQAFKDKKLERISKNKTKVAYCEKQFSLLQKKCGERVFELTEVKNLYEEILSIKAAEKKLKLAQSEFETAIENYTEEVGEAPSAEITKLMLKKKEETQITEEADKQAEEAQAQQAETVTESYESAEAKIKVIEDLRTEAKNSAKYWGEKANDQQHGRRGVATTMNLLAAGAIDGYTLENYETEISKVGNLVPYNEPYAKSMGRKIPELFYDLPLEAAAFTTDMASNTAHKIKAAQNLSEPARAAASLFYNDFYKDKDPNTIAPSINEFIGSCNSMVTQLKAGKSITEEAA